MPELERIPVTRIVATPAALDALDALRLPAYRVLRTAPDEALVLPPAPADQLRLTDPHALVFVDGGFAGVWLDASRAHAFLERTCEWALPAARPAFAQGTVAGVATKLYLETDRVLLLIPAPVMHDFSDALKRHGGAHA